MVTPPSNRTIAGRVRVAMEESGHSEKSLADDTGIARTTLRRRLSGGSSFTTTELITIAELVGASLLDFLADEETAA